MTENLEGIIPPIIYQNITVEKESPAIVLRDKAGNGYFIRLEEGSLIIKDQFAKKGICLENGQVYLVGETKEKLVSEKDLLECDKLIGVPDFSVKITASSGFECPAKGWIRAAAENSLELRLNDTLVASGCKAVLLPVKKGQVVTGEFDVLEFYPCEGIK